MLPRTLRTGTQRRERVRAADCPLNGIDEVEVLDATLAASDPLRQRVLFVHFFKPLPSSQEAPTLPPLVGDNVRVVRDGRGQDIPVRWGVEATLLADLGVELPGIPSEERDSIRSTFNTYSVSERARMLVVRVGGYTGRFEGDSAPYQLALVASSSDDAVPTGYDLELSAAPVFFKAACPTDFDCVAPSAPAPRPAAPPLAPLAIDYLARDAEALRETLLDRLATRLPAWDERSPADPGIAVVELLAYAGDRLAYLQDAVGTEAFLGTARRRVSVRRHARLLDYVLHEGCSARTWARFTPAHASVTVPAGTQLVVGSDARLVFETMHDVSLDLAHEVIVPYAFGEETYTLAAGATRASLRVDAPLSLAAGDVILFEEIARTDGAHPDPRRRHVVRLRAVGSVQVDTLTTDAFVDVAWHDDDALPFDVPVCAPGLPELTIVRGNLALADHGRTVDASASLPEIVDDAPYHPRVPSVASVVPHVDTRSARAAFALEPHRAVPAITLDPSGDPWSAVADLLESGADDRHFVVEVESDGTTSLRFGDGTYGRRPIGALTYRYRAGGGAAGNVFANVLIAQTEGPRAVPVGVLAATNPLPARGGADAELVEEARERAPQRFRTDALRAVTEADYARHALAFDDVQRAVATRRWTGAGHTVFVAIDRLGGREVDDAYRAALEAALEPLRLAGEAVVVEAPVYVPLEIVMTVCLARDHRREDVLAALRDRFTAGLRADGQKGFFHPDHLTFGQPVYASQVIEAAATVPGVDWVDLGESDARNRFGRLASPARIDRERGRITMGRLEIARLDGNPDRPGDGHIDFLLRGGL